MLIKSSLNKKPYVVFCKHKVLFYKFFDIDIEGITLYLEFFVIV